MARVQVLGLPEQTRLPGDPRAPCAGGVTIENLSASPSASVPESVRGRAVFSFVLTVWGAATGA